MLRPQHFYASRLKKYRFHILNSIFLKTDIDLFNGHILTCVKMSYRRKLMKYNFKKYLCWLINFILIF